MRETHNEWQENKQSTNIANLDRGKPSSKKELPVHCQMLRENHNDNEITISLASFVFSFYILPLKILIIKCIHLYMTL